MKMGRSQGDRITNRQSGYQEQGNEGKGNGDKYKEGDGETTLPPR